MLFFYAIVLFISKNEMLVLFVFLNIKLNHIFKKFIKFHKNFRKEKMFQMKHEILLENIPNLIKVLF